MDRTAAEQNLSLRDPPQAENPAEQDSIFIMRTQKGKSMSEKTKRYVLLGLTIGWVLLIFFFSSQNGLTSSKNSDGLSVWITRHVLGSEVSELEAEVWEHCLRVASYCVRKVAHMTEYAVLSALLSLLLRTYGHPLWRHCLLGFLGAAAYAATDELHQLFVPGRSGQLLDVGIDSIGAFTGGCACFLCLLLGAAWEKQKKEKDRK